VKKRKKLSKKSLWRIAFLFWLAVFGLVVWRQIPDDKLHLFFCDISQGDAILARHKSSQVLIDGGRVRNSGKLLKCLARAMPFWDRKIEMVVATHPDEDHFGGLIEVARRYQIGVFLHNGLDKPDSWQFQKLKNLVIEQEIYSRKAVAGERFRVSKMYFDILWPGVETKPTKKILPKGFLNLESFSGDFNQQSIVLHLRFGQFDSLLTGDATVEVEQILAWRKKLFPVEVLKLGHHGSKTSTGEEILLATQPQLAIISVGENNHFGHPAPEVLERLKQYEIPYLRTDKQGTIEITSDGRKWEVK